MSKIGALEAERLESLGRLQRALMGVIDVPGWGADSPFVVQDVSEKQRRLRFGVKADAAWCMARPVHHREPRDRLAVLEQARRPTRAGHDESGEPRRQPVDQTPQRHEFLRPAWPKVGRVGLVHRETRAGRLAECERSARVIDVVVREDDPIDPANALLLKESKDRPEAAGIAGVDDRETLAAPVQVRLRAAHTRNPLNHFLIMVWVPPKLA